MHVIPIVLEAALKVSLLLAIAGLATILMQKQSAAARHAVWVVSVLAALAIPPMANLLPPWRAGVLDLPTSLLASSATEIPGEIQTGSANAGAARESAKPGDELSGVAVEYSPLDVAPTVRPESSISSAPRPRISFTLSAVQILFALWAFGSLVALAPFVISMIRVRTFARRAHHGLSPLWEETLAQLPRDAIPVRRVEYMESSETSMPLACGIFSPVVIVPCKAEGWPAWKRRNILVHELAHVQRFDCLTQAFATLLCSIYWFNPLAWIAASRMRIERELACDDRVLAAGSQAVDYADHLLEVARSFRPPSGTAMAAIAMARTSNLSTRLIAVLDTKRSRRSVSRSTAGLLCALSLILMLPLAAFKPWKSESVQIDSRPAAALDHQANAGRIRETASVNQPADFGGLPMMSGILHGLANAVLLDPKAAPPVGFAPLVAQSALEVCRDGKSSSSTHISQHDEGIQRLTLKYSSGDDCSLEIVADGKFTFADDLSDIASLAPGATMTIKETNGRTVRKLEISSVGGAIQRKFSLNGVSSPFGENERRWLADILLAVERRTGFSAGTRVPRLWENGGVKAVLAEVEAMTGSYAKRIYLDALFDLGIDLDGPTLARIIRTTGTAFDSDYERRLVLSRMPSQKFMDENAWNAFAEAVARMSSDYEKRLVITQAFDKGQLSASVAAKLLNSVSSMKSSYEIGQILKGPALNYATSSVSRPAYIAAVRKMGSDYELRQVLVALVDQAAATPGAIADLLAPASTIQSDYELGQVIVSFARRGSLSMEAVNTLTRLAGAMKSDYEKHRALKALISSTPRPDSRGLAELLSAARSINSDYELSSFLKEVVARFPWKEIPRDAFERALQTISSDTDQNAVRAAMQRAETR